ncbi:MAG TPA: KTSC domain-containing protein [Thermoanaerobaculia bacterium]|nr:KTSC domain-containing protein [Thermoanaerobaculia bacterium]
MRREHVESSAISSVGYDAKARTLEVEFSSGAVYKYRGVPPGIYRSLMNASSKGQFVSRRVRDRFPFTRIEH